MSKRFFKTVNVLPFYLHNLKKTTKCVDCRKFIMENDCWPKRRMGVKCEQFEKKINESGINHFIFFGIDA